MISFFFSHLVRFCQRLYQMYFIHWVWCDLLSVKALTLQNFKNWFESLLQLKTEVDQGLTELQCIYSFWPIPMQIKFSYTWSFKYYLIKLKHPSHKSRRVIKIEVDKLYSRIISTAHLSFCYLISLDFNPICRILKNKSNLTQGCRTFLMPGPWHRQLCTVSTKISQVTNPGLQLVLGWS